MRPLLVWVDEKWRRRYTHAPLMFPFWGVVTSDKAPFQKNIFETYRFDTRYYQLAASIEEADVVFLPYRFNVLKDKEPRLVAEVATTAERAGKKVLIDGTGDIEYSIPMDHAIILRIGGYRFLRQKNEIHIPLYTDDLLERECGGALQLREKGTRPHIAFSGWTHMNGVQTMKTVIKEASLRARSLFDSRYRACRKGIFFRKEALDALRSSPRIEPNFRERASYSAHVATASDDPQVLRRQFVENLLQSDYGLDVRGDANNSARLFEILSLGRIPIIIDTERNFPFEDEIDYSSFSFRIDFREIDLLPQRIADFHESLSPERFAAMQQAARDAYVQYCRLDAMAPRIVKRIHEYIRSF